MLRLDRSVYTPRALCTSIDIVLVQVTVVASVVSVKNQATNSSYTLDDGGGQFEARHWTDANANEDDNGIRYVKDYL